MNKQISYQISADTIALAYRDTLVQEDPASHPPVSLLGFDPVLSMPSLEDFTDLIKQQKRSLKALLLDQVTTASTLQKCFKDLSSAVELSIHSLSPHRYTACLQRDASA